MFTPIPGVAKLSVLAIVAISTIMTISMHSDALAEPTTTPIAPVGDPGYQLTVNVPSYPAGTSTLDISITSADGYTDNANVAASGVTSWTFKIPTNQGWVRVCVNSDISSGETCKTYDATGADMTVSLSPPSGDSNSYYVYPGNSYYIYPGIRHDYYFHHGDDHGFGGHDYGGEHRFGGHQDSGNIGSGGNGFNGHQDTGNGFNGHQDTGNGFNGHQDTGNGFNGHQDTGNGFNGHHDRSNNKVANLGSVKPSLGTTNEDDQ
jgi:hypothetical protein